MIHHKSLSLRRRPLLLAAAVVLSVAGCSRGADPDHAKEHTTPAGQGAATKQLPLSRVVEGLRPEHRGKPPLVEKVAYIPASEHGAPGTTNLTRVYSDGAFYMLTEPEPGSATPPRWTYLYALRPGGVGQLEALFARSCQVLDSSRAEDSGRVEYHVTSKACTRTFVNGLPSNASPIREVDDILRTHAGTIPPSP